MNRWPTTVTNYFCSTCNWTALISGYNFITPKASRREEGKKGSERKDRAAGFQFILAVSEQLWQVGMFEDPASAAYQLETAARSLKRRLGEARENAGEDRGVVLPGLIRPVDGPEFWRFYEDLADWLYEKGR